MFQGIFLILRLFFPLSFGLLSTVLIIPLYILFLLSAFLSPCYIIALFLSYFNFGVVVVTIAGSSYIVTSSVTLADLETVNKYRPSALTITDPDSKEILFKVGTGSNSISIYGISFGGISNDGGKLATTTLMIPSDVENAKEFVLDKAGLAIANLEKIESSIGGVLEEIRAERNALSERIMVSV